MKAEHAMDQIDKQILAQLQVNAAQPVADIARKVGLSVTPCWRRIQRMEETGLIRKRVALLDPRKLVLACRYLLLFGRISIMPNGCRILPVWLLICRKLLNFTV
jgi:DNA-binding Lrp family transcriptional regulator